MNTIKLTRIDSTVMGTIYVNPTHIGYFYPHPMGKYTTIGVTTHINGVFQVLETPEEILLLISNTNTDTP